MNKIYFVVLHYQAIGETIDCVNSLIKLKTPHGSSYVIIVDNASPNKSGMKLKMLFKENKQVNVVLCNENLGFAKGNNIGFKIAKNEGADFIVLINNDTLIKDENFLNKIDDIYKKTGFSVLGPDILSIKDQIHQNPMTGFDITVSSLRRKIMKARIILFMNKVGLTRFIVLKKNRNSVFKNKYTEECTLDRKSNLVLHGSCLIFSRKYIDKYDGLYDGTFMYYEENILAYRCFENNLKMVYSPTIQIEHYRNVSTNMTYNKNEKRKLEFFYRQMISSLSCLLEMVNK